MHSVIFYIAVITVGFSFYLQPYFENWSYIYLPWKSSLALWSATEANTAQWMYSATTGTK